MGDSTEIYVLSSSNFQVDQQGNLTASNTSISGSINASYIDITTGGIIAG